jgi:ferredoxin
VACIVAVYIRQLGYPARAQTDQDSEVLQPPLVLLAGLGELSRIGEVVLNPFLGPRFKSSVITTDLPLIPDRPIDFGLQKFCQDCKKCARECPCSAISFGDKVMFNGYEMWKPDVAACTRYRVSNPGGSSCGRCMKVCPYNEENLLHHRLALWLTMHVPALNRTLIWLDDLLQHGRREPAFKWWWDLEYRDGRLQRAEKVNERDLHPRRQPPPNHVIPIYAIDAYPPPDLKEPFPILRRDGLPIDASEAQPGPQEGGPKS